MAKIVQRRGDGAAPKYFLVTPSGDTWYCYQWIFRHYRDEGVPWRKYEDAPDDLRHIWHLLDPDDKYVKSFRQLWEAKKYVSDQVDKESAEETK